MTSDLPLAQRLVPEVEAGHHVEPHILLPAGGALQAAVHCLPALAAHATQGAGPLGDVVVQEVDACVRALTQVPRGEVRHAGGLFVVVGRRIVHVRLWVGQPLERSVV